jgi:Acyltransferase family
VLPSTACLWPEKRNGQLILKTPPPRELGTLGRCTGAPRDWVAHRLLAGSWSELTIPRCRAAELSINSTFRKKLPLAIYFASRSAVSSSDFWFEAPVGIFGLSRSDGPDKRHFRHYLALPFRTSRVPGTVVPLGCLNPLRFTILRAICCPGKALNRIDLTSVRLVAAWSAAKRAPNRLPSDLRTLKQGIEYRPEIDGLRAIAVLAVVFFHQTLAMFSGGFVGVDIFFVISGYLITYNIVADARTGKFSFASFYMKRARRILPALFFTIAVTFIAAALLLAPETLRELSKESTHALLSISNIHSGENRVPTSPKPQISYRSCISGPFHSRCNFISYGLL